MIIILGCLEAKNEGIDHPVMLTGDCGSSRCKGGWGWVGCWPEAVSGGGDLGSSIWGTPTLFTVSRRAGPCRPGLPSSRTTGDPQGR